VYRPPPPGITVCPQNVTHTSRSWHSCRGPRNDDKSVIGVRQTTTDDYGTFRVPPLMSKRTMGIRDEGGWRRRRRDLRLRHCNRVTVEQKFNTDQSGKNAESTSRMTNDCIERSANCTPSCCLFSEIVAIIKVIPVRTYTSTVRRPAPPTHPHECIRLVLTETTRQS